MTVEQSEMRQAHMNTIDTLLSAEGETPEMFHYVKWTRGLVEVLPLSPMEKRAVYAYLWREQVEKELKKGEI